MNDMHSFEQQLASGLGQLAGPRRSVDAMAISRDVISQSPKWRFQSMFSATKFVVAGAVVALFSGFLLAGVLTQPSEEQVPAVGASANATTAADPTAEASTGPEATLREATRDTITLPQELPAGSRRGTLDTDAGSIEWVRVSAPIFPEAANGFWLQQLVPWDDGIAAWSAAGARTMLASSTDGVHWQREELPSEPDAGKHWAAYGDAGLGVIDGTAYLVLSESGQVWARELDDGEWSQLDAAAIGEAKRGEGWTGANLRASDPVKIGNLPYFEVSDGDEGRHTSAFVIDGSTVVEVEPRATGAPDIGNTFAPSQAPADTRLENGIDWLLREASDARRTSRWLAVGEQWVSLGDVVPRSQQYLYGARTGNVIALTGDPGQAPTQLWVLVLPEDTLAEPVAAEPVEEIEPTDTATTHDLLPGVDLVTEEVKPGLYRVVSDGIRDVDAIRDVAPLAQGTEGSNPSSPAIPLS